MSAKITALVITLLINIAAVVVILMGMLLAMNGYSESDAMWGLGAFGLLGLVVTVVMSAGAFLLTGLLTRRQFSPAVSALIAIISFSVIGIGLGAVSSLIGVGVAEFVRVNY